ncbi:MAG: isocitrate lyase/phosphoenolpyruvate mutase family protein [Ignavibacteria bacterium]
MINQKERKEKADLFLKLHHDKEILVLLNSWDPGSSKLIEASGFKAIATTSMGISASLGYPDCEVIPFDEMVGAISRITSKVKLPVTVDFEGGFGNNTEEILKSAQRIFETGIVGINIEDSRSLDPQLLDETEFCERISAIRDLSYSLGFHLVINARTDVFLAASGSPNSRLDEAIRRGNIYKEAGADCIFVPNVWERGKISVLVKEINAPVNILVNPTNGTGLPPHIKELENMGVSRVSTGSSVMKSTLALANKIAQEMLLKVTYNALTDAVTPIEDTLLAYKMATGTDE